MTWNNSFNMGIVIIWGKVKDMFGSWEVQRNGEEKYEEKKNSEKFMKSFSCLIVHEKLR